MNIKSFQLKVELLKFIYVTPASARVFACIGDGEGKNRDFGGEMLKMEKVRYGSNDRRKPRKALNYCGFERS